MKRLLVLEEARLAVIEDAVEAIEPPGPEGSALWLPALLGDRRGPKRAARRSLRLRGGGSIDVPAVMRIDDDIPILELPDLLRAIGARCGIIGLAELSCGLSLVCDPCLLTPEELGRPQR